LKKDVEFGSFNMTREEKIEKLKKLKSEMKADKSLPLRKGATQLVFGDGNPNADVYFIGEAPGFHEDRLGLPFVGQAGKLLDKLIAKIGLTRKDVYISNVVRFRPPANRDPEPEEIAAFQPYVDREIEIVNPKIIVTLGRFSMGKFIPFEKISGIHGKPRSIMWNNREILVIPMYHPAAALRAGAIMRQLEQDFFVIKDELAKLEGKKKEELEKVRLEEEERKKPKQDRLF
jgi:uracil-DNA glycosylase family 4